MLSGLMLMIERIYIREASENLRCSTRSFKRWCRNNDVGILKDGGSQKQYVIRAEFEKAKMRVPLLYLKEKYGADKVPDLLRICTDFQAELRRLLGGEKQTGYKPKGKYERDFLNKLQSQ